MLSPSSQRLALAAVVVGTGLALAACGEQGSQQAAAGKSVVPSAQAQTQAPPPPTVGVVTVRAQPVGTTVDLPGRLEAYRTAEVRPQVGGIVTKRLFQEGTQVKAGQALYQLEDASYRASLESARAQLASAQAALAKATADLGRYKPLVEADAISKLEYDAAVAARRSAEASVQSGRAAVQAAQINVNYSRVTAPIAGYIGQSFVSEGALVSAGSTKLATIQQTNVLYVNVTQSATEAMQLRQDIADGKRSATNGAVEVSIKLEGGKEYPHKGRLLFADPTVDATTGQVTLRAEVPNPDNVLLPGLYVRVGLPQGAIGHAFVVPQQAVTRGKQDTVMIVNAEGGMEPRVVTVAGQQGSDWVLSAGLQDGDKVIVDGIMIAGMMGAKQVQTREWQPQGGAGAPVAPAAPAASEAASAAQ